MPTPFSKTELSPKEFPHSPLNFERFGGYACLAGISSFLGIILFAAFPAFAAQGTKRPARIKLGMESAGGYDASLPPRPVNGEAAVTLEEIHLTPAAAAPMPLPLDSILDMPAFGLTALPAADQTPGTNHGPGGAKPPRANGHIFPAASARAAQPRSLSEGGTNAHSVLAHGQTPASFLDEWRIQHSELLDWDGSQGKTLVFVQSLSFEPEIIHGVSGMEKYDARAIALILAAQNPKVRHLVFVTSEKVPDYVIDHLVGGRPDADKILAKVHFITCDDNSKGSGIPLAQKLLRQTNAGTLDRIKILIGQWGDPAALIPYRTTPWEGEIARRIGIPLYSSHPALRYYGTKSGSRKVFREVGLELAPGFEDMHSQEQIEESIGRLWSANHGLRGVMIKTDNGVSGLGNLLARLPHWMRSASARKAAIRNLVRTEIPGMRLPDGTAGSVFLALMQEKGGVVEEFVERVKSAPSGQAEIRADGSILILSTHDQKLSRNKVYLGATYPANERYRKAIEMATLGVARNLAAKGVFGRFSVDYLVVVDGTRLRIVPTEINLRSAATNHPYFAARDLTRAELRDGLLVRPDGKKVFYHAMDHSLHPGLKGIDMKAFLRYFADKNILFDERTNTGVLFHLLDAVPLNGNVGFTAVATTRREAHRIVARLERLLKELEDQNHPFRSGT